MIVGGPSQTPVSGGGLAGPPPDQTAPEEPLTGARADRDRDLFWAAQFTPSVTEVLDGDVERWRERMREHSEAACLHLTAVVEPASAPRAQLYALPFVPAAIARERERFGAYATRTMGGNLLADLVQEEVRRRDRVVAIDAEAVLLAAFAGRVPYQLMLVPRTARMRFEDDGPSGEELLADALGRLASRLDGAEVELWVRTAPQGAEHFCWRIDIAPQLPAPGGGLEHGTGVAVNPVAPEQAAAELRDR